MANITRHVPTLPRLSRFDPFHEFENMMERFGMRPFMGFGEAETPSFIKLDMTENEREYKVYAEIPGVKKEDIRVAVEGNRVSISADIKETQEKKDGDKLIWHERYAGHEARSFTLDSEVDEAKSQAKYADGVLELTLPKKAGGAVSKEIKIS